MTAPTGREAAGRYAGTRVTQIDMSVEKVVRMHEKEEVVGVIRQFPLAYLNHLALSLLLFTAPFFFMLPLFQLGAFGLTVFSLLALTGLFFAFRTLVRWYWTMFIVTNQRIIDVDQKGFFDRFVSEASYEKVQDISYARKGVWGTVLNYGTLVVQTAGSTAHLEQYYVRRPQDVQHMIVQAMAGHLAGPPGERNEKVSALLEAASALSNTEARAFLHEIKGAVDAQRQDMVHSTDEQVERFMAGDDEQLAEES